ncbi:unnamed protein product [Ectocarpus sp. 6 AP-2014]
MGEPLIRPRLAASWLFATTLYSVHLKRNPSHSHDRRQSQAFSVFRQDRHHGGVQVSATLVRRSTAQPGENVASKYHYPWTRLPTGGTSVVAIQAWRKISLDRR